MKKIIAWAIAGLISVPAFAQSNVQIYGVIDLGFRHLSGSEMWPPGAKSRSAIDSSGQSVSRLGFRGTEDLGNGLKAFFTIESELAPDYSSQTVDDRKAFVGLEGRFGRAWLGRDYNPSRAFVADLDPFGMTGIGSAQQLFGQQTWYSNGVFYRTPDFDGLSVSLAYSRHFWGPDESPVVKGDPDLNGKAWSITPVYRRGALTVGFGYERYSGDFFDGKRWNLGGRYDFGVVDIRLAYGGDEYEPYKRKVWMIGAAIPVSERGKVLASYVRHKADSKTSWPTAKASLWALGYTHDLSKRTAVYATYARIRTNDGGHGGYGLGTRNPWEETTFGGTAYTRGFNIGLRHNF